MNLNPERYQQPYTFFSSSHRKRKNMLLVLLLSLKNQWGHGWAKIIQEIFEGRNKKAHRRTVHLGNWGKALESSIRKGEMASIYWKEYRKVFSLRGGGTLAIWKHSLGILIQTHTAVSHRKRSQRSLVKAITSDFYPKSQRSSSDRNYQSLPPGCLELIYSQPWMKIWYNGLFHIPFLYCSTQWLLLIKEMQGSPL